MLKDYMKRTFEDQEVIFKEGERGAEAFLINAGYVKIFRDEGGTEKEIDSIGPGQIFGEMGIISDSNRMATAQAIGPTELICCHRRELKRKIDALNEDRRDALRFLIVYCQEFMPYELMDNRPDTEESRHMDEMAYYLIRDSKKANELDSLDTFLKGLYRVLVSYAERRLPPGYKPD